MSATVRISRSCGACPAGPNFLACIHNRSATPAGRDTDRRSCRGFSALFSLPSLRFRITRPAAIDPETSAMPASALAERRQCVRGLPVYAVRWPAHRAGGNGAFLAPPSPGRVVPDASWRHRPAFPPWVSSVSSMAVAARRLTAQGAGQPASGRDRPPSIASQFLPSLAHLHVSIGTAAHYKAHGRDERVSRSGFVRLTPKDFLSTAARN